MKKQRILALTLAAATATSVFGGFSASAATKKDADAYQGKNYPAYTAKTDSWDLSSITKDTKVSVEKPGDVDVFDKDTYYIYDYKVQKGSGDNEGSLANIEDAMGTEGLKQAVADYLNKGNASGTIHYEEDDYSAADSTRQAVITEFLAVLDDANDMVKNETLKNFYDEDEVAAFKLDIMVNEIAGLDDSGLTIANYHTSQLAYYVSEYNRLLGEDGAISPNYSWEEKYEEELAKADDLVEDDYSAPNWIKVQNQLDLAAGYAADGDYDKAYDAVNYIFTDIETKTPSYSDLKKALQGLFDNDTSFNNALPAWSSTGVKVENVKPYGTIEGVKYSYLSTDYDDKDQWYEFAGRSTNPDGVNYVAGAYRKAMAVYVDCTKSTTRKFVAQSTVDKALDDLNAAILALDPNYTTPEWVVVKLQTLLDEANALVETDYRTTATYWKEFVKARDAVENLLASDNIKDSVGESYYDDLKAAMNDLSKCQKTVDTATKNDLKVAMKEAETLLKDKDNKSANQIIALEDALAAAEKVYGKSGKTISAYESATEALNTAIAGYNQIQGWYMDGGKWYYGVGDSKATGWLNVGGTWYYLNTDGSMATGWLNLNGTWYYLNANGSMATGWLNLNGTYYYLKSWGGMATGWNMVNGTWYYMQPSGAMVANGWYSIGGKSYYFYSWGGMAANTTTPDGYKVGADGAWIK
ncbi:MAG: hypothetical protein ACOX6P_11775 [Candidatus Merdivicinus sp.]|jgi:glucan-binding YG repeat protein